MKGSVAISLLLATLPVGAYALDCPTSGVTQITGVNIVPALQGRMVCGISDVNSDRWQEHHASGSTLTEYAKGPGDPVDPSHVVGEWGSSGDHVTYTYPPGGATTYAFRLYRDDTDTDKFYFCSTTDTTLVATATTFVSASPASCGF